MVDGDGDEGCYVTRYKMLLPLFWRPAVTLIQAVGIRDTSLFQSWDFVTKYLYA